MHLAGSLFAIVCAFSFVRSTPLNSRIINGEEAPEEHPWVARIVTDIVPVEGGNSVTTDCGGSLIAQDWVLTAKHCLLNEDLTQIGTPSNYHVFIGNNNYPRGQFIQVTDHYFYSNQSYVDDDIALLKLANAPDGVDPIPTEYDNLDDDEYSGSLVTLYGWGLTNPKDGNSQVTQLRQTQVELYTDGCEDNVLCFDPTVTDTNSCEGDSGGPMTMELNGVETLIGVTHVGQVLDKVPCSGTFSSYTKTFYPAYAEWIQNTMMQ